MSLAAIAARPVSLTAVTWPVSLAAIAARPAMSNMPWTAHLSPLLHALHSLRLGIAGPRREDGARRHVILWRFH
jgi:hypothetical protein